MKSIAILGLVLLGLSYGNRNPVYEGETWVNEGCAMRIVCKISMLHEQPFALQWTRNNQPLNMSREVGYSIVDEVLESESTIVSVLTVRNARASLHGGLYRCEKFSSHGHLIVVLSANGNDVTVEFKRNMEGDFVLNCSLPANEVEWIKNGARLNETETMKMEKGESGLHMLRFTKPRMSDIGSYTCQGKDGRGASIEIRVAMEPHVSKFTSSANVVEGEVLRVTCTVSGYPVPTVEWRRLKEGEDGGFDKVESDGRFQLLEANGYPDSMLVINNTVMEDRGEYMCYAENYLGSSNSTVLIRVIDKYAALWPFLGICVEVIVLCAVIFLFERRRGKKQLDESDTEQNNAKHVVNTKDSEVRNRK